MVGFPHVLAVTGLANASAWAVYAVGAVLALAGAFGVVLMRNPVHCALSLVTTIFGIAMLFIDQGADFLAAVQIIVYAGAIVILFLFVIMLLGVDQKEPRTASGPLKGLLPAGIAVSVIALAELLVLARVHYWATGTLHAGQAANGPGENIQKIGESIFTSFLLPFEMTAALLVIAVVAAVSLVRRATDDSNSPQGRRPQVAAKPQPSAPPPGFSHAGMARPSGPQAGQAGQPGAGTRTTSGGTKR